MKVYIASRFGLKDEIRTLFKKLKEKGHEIVGDWTSHKPIKPYDENVELSREYSIEDIDCSANCDVFILISDEAGTGMYIELGVAILANKLFGKPKIYVVGKHNSRSMYFFHPSVIRVDTIEEVLDEL